MRQRAWDIEQFWSTLHDDNRCHGPATYTDAFISASEQLCVCQRLKFQAGLLSYVALHCVEASSGLLVELQQMKPKRQKEVEPLLLVC